MAGIKGGCWLTSHIFTDNKFHGLIDKKIVVSGEKTHLSLTSLGMLG